MYTHFNEPNTTVSRSDQVSPKIYEGLSQTCKTCPFSWQPNRKTEISIQLVKTQKKCKKEDILYPCDFTLESTKLLSTCPTNLFTEPYAKMGFKKSCITIMSSFFCSFLFRLAPQACWYKDGKGWRCVLGSPFGYICCDKWGYHCVFACVYGIWIFFNMGSDLYPSACLVGILFRGVCVSLLYDWNGEILRRHKTYVLLLLFRYTLKSVERTSTELLWQIIHTFQ